MRITKLKLAGFKSFVDPTTLHLPANLTAVVGPNGCGKSNIIDAMIWVMGESSAKHLRGDSMADVIFNGSNSRKPVGQASVEIVFDNSDGTIGGQFAGYNEIAIKRALARDGVSTYTLNGTRCRRKDILNVFLGTGLAGRGAYSVIEQGMISRVVEAKPEELRNFLEEAAGISKYKERRRETENRIRHTRENLERLEDLREELDKRQQHLKRQARAAERYQELKAEARQVDAERLALRWREVEAERAAHAAHISERETAVEAAVAELRGIETAHTTLREEQQAGGDELQGIQARFYEKTSEIARLEQSLQHADERQTNMLRDLEQAQSDLVTVTAELQTLQSELAGTVAMLGESEPRLVGLAEQEQAAATALQEIEQQAERWQESWDEYNDTRARAASDEQADQVRLEHLASGLAGTRERLESLEAEREALADLEDLDEVRAAADEALRAAERGQQERTQSREAIYDALVAARRDSEQVAAALHASRSELETARGRLASLRALQEAALGQDDAQAAELDALGFDSARVLADELAIEGGWEAAVEAAVRLPLSTLCAPGSVETLLTAAAAPPHDLTVIEPAAQPATAPPAAAPTLQSKVSSGFAADFALHGVLVADSLEQAREMRTRLAPHESVILADGTWLGPNWARRPGRDSAERTGILERAGQIETLTRTVDAAAARASDQQAALETARTQVVELESSAAALDQELRAAVERVAAARGELSQADADVQAARERTARVTGEIQRLQAQSAENETAHEALSSRLGSMRTRLDALETRREQLISERAMLTATLDQRRAQWREARERSHAVALELENARARRHALADKLAGDERAHAQLAARSTDLEHALAASEAPRSQLREQLDAALGSRGELEETLNAARRRIEALAERGLEFERRRHAADEVVSARREELEQARLDERSHSVRLQEIVERIAETEHTIEPLLEALPEDAASAAWDERLQDVERRIDRLGPINLAAIDEFAQVSERKEYLDRQHADLAEALDTLQGAIRKIDKETRTRFKETFDRVNAGLQEKFPLLFGGGHAYLEMTGDELLETGITVMARPPGKRNSTIHLLSGGEKALTAVAFVFALFELNPAPFCLLDEVDAPLDDTNVGRLAELLQQMSDRVQFLCVTHNKITMEIAAQLVGVTMQEAGVSRLVSVNMEQAVEMAAAG